MMNTNLRNRVLYWAMALIPLSGIWAVGKLCGSIWFTAFFLFYLFIYRPTLDVQRLMSLGKIEEKDAWKFFVPLLVDRMRYNRSLWLG